MDLFQRGYRVAAATTAVLLTLVTLGSILGSSVQAKSLTADQALPSLIAVGLDSRQQITDTTDITETVDITDTAEITDTEEISETEEITDTAEMTDTTAMADTEAITDTATMAESAMGGTGPENALTPTDASVTLGACERRWYVFKYDYDSEADDPSNVIAELRIDEPGTLSFEVWSEQNVNQWRNGEDFTPTGAGTPAFAINEGTSNRDRTLLRWVGGSRETVLYYLIVSNRTDAPANYRLTVTGPNVSFPAPAMATTTEMTGTMVTTDTVASPVETTMGGGTGPDDALTPTGQRTTLAAGEQRWYTFGYGSDDEDDVSQAMAELRMAQPGSVSFEVWSQDDVNRWRNGEDFTPTGAGTPAFAIGEGDDNRDRSLLRWAGSSTASAIYYIIVQNNTDGDAFYRLTVTGFTVSFPAPAGVAATTEMTDTAEMADPAVMTETAIITETAAMTDSAEMTETAVMTEEMAGSSGPENAGAITGQRETLAAGEQRWYTFAYTYDEETDDDGVPSNVMVELRMAQPDSVSFEVWSGDNVTQWQNSEDFTPTGTGTPAFAIGEDEDADNRDRSLLRWVGSAETMARFYVIVENNTDADASYRLTISGPTVSN